MFVWVRRNATVFFACGILIAAGGCAKSFTARKFPVFYDPNLRTVAVVPFVNETRVPGAGVLVAEDVAAALQANGTYSILSPRRLRTLVRQKKLQQLWEGDAARNAGIFRRFGSVQAFVMGRVVRDISGTQSYPRVSGDTGYYTQESRLAGPDRYQLAPEASKEEQEEEERFGDEYSPYYYPYWYWNYPYHDYPEYMAQARIAVVVSMVRTSDGAVLYETPAPVVGHANLTGSHRITSGDAILDAAHRAVTRIVKDLAVVPVTVTVTPGTDIRTAVGRTDGRWDFSDTVSASDEWMYVVLRLPPLVGRNSFRLTVTPRRNPNETVTVRDFVWPVGARLHAVQFSPREIVAHAGPGQYTVSFCAQGQQVMQHNFKIE